MNIPAVPTCPACQGKGCVYNTAYDHYDPEAAAGRSLITVAEYEEARAAFAALFGPEMVPCLLCSGGSARSELEPGSKESAFLRWLQSVPPLPEGNRTPSPWKQLCFRCQFWDSGSLSIEGAPPTSKVLFRFSDGSVANRQGGIYCPGCAPNVRFCRACGCSDEAGCVTGCYWLQSDLCSACAHEMVGQPWKRKL